MCNFHFLVGAPVTCSHSLALSPVLRALVRLTGELVGHARLIRSAFGGISHLWTGVGSYRVIQFMIFMLNQTEIGEIFSKLEILRYSKEHGETSPLFTVEP